MKVPDRDGIPFGARLAAADRAAGRDVSPWQPRLDDYAPPEAENDQDFDRIWHERELFTHIHQFARARRVSPWAVLGCTLTRVVAATPPWVQLPPIIGSHASLNLFVGLVGPSGAGKDSSRKVAKEALLLDPSLGARPFLEAPLGSGEGLSHMFMRRPRATKEDPDPPLVQYNDAALVTVSEIDSLGAIAGRQASTLLPQLRQAAMGEDLGFFYVDTTKRMLVPEHRYRLCLVAGIQPLRAAVLLDDEGGGTPQRFLWVPVPDREAPDVRPPEPTRRFAWRPPQWVPDASGRVELKVCDEAFGTIEAHHLKRLREETDALDAHSLLTRLKVAAAFTLLDGRTAIGDADWELSGILAELSALTRTRVQGALNAEAQARNAAQAEAEASRAIVVRTRGDADTMRRVTAAVRRALARAAGMDDGWLASGKLMRTLPGRDREHFEACVSMLVDTGEVDEEAFEYRGHEGVRYRLRKPGV